MKSITNLLNLSVVQDEATFMTYIISEKSNALGLLGERKGRGILMV
jgi:hypothetical protein